MSTVARTDTVVADSPQDAAPLSPLSWRAVLGIAGGLVVVLLCLSTRWGYHLDELYNRVAALHPQWGYVDEPPLVPILVRGEIAVFGDSLTAIRVLPALAVGLMVVVAALIARELGGTARAQVLAAAATVASVVTLNTGHIVGTNAIDVVAWVVTCWLVIRLIRTRDERLYLVIGAVVGVDLLAKYLIVLLLVGLVGGILLAGPRRILRSWYLAGGTGIAVVLATPTLIWQAVHGWPQFAMAGALAKALGGEARIAFLPFQLLMIGLFLAPVWIAGLIGLLRAPRWRAYRVVGVAYVVMVVLLLVIAGQPDYTSALLVVLLAAGCVRTAEWARTSRRRALTWSAVVVNGIVAAVLMLPVLPIQAYADNPVLQQLGVVQLDQSDWPQLVDQVAAVYRSLPATDQAHTVLYGNHYGQAGALDRFGPALGLPKAYSGQNSYAQFGVPTDDKTVVITVGVDRATFAPNFDSCEQHGTLNFDIAVSDQHQPLMVCRGPKLPWQQIWPKLTWIGFQCDGTTKPVTAQSKTGC
jgi:4-amino-4-deoxy-L-arabinose transferase-like glycosyltransferase